ncbi:MAG: sigma 54-interacting transcriptional regulator [Desulfobacterales bacterium]|nr:MAG: sigma 54-interacting transcriptional regulator [Desulfobacterales bacterium]
MQRDDYRIGFIASSISLTTSARKIAKERNEDFIISSKGLEHATSVGKDMEASGVEVIISRGGTAYLLRENLQIPVLTIPLTSFDILASIYKASTSGKKVMLASFRWPLRGIEIVEQLLQIDIIQGIYQDSESLEEAIFSAKREGCEVVIGGGVSMVIARKYDLKMVELETSADAIVSIIEDAKSVAKSRRQEQKKWQTYQSIIDSTSEGIIAVDQGGVITAANRVVKELLNISEPDINNKHITKYARKAHILEVLRKQKPILNRLEDIRKNKYVSNHFPIIVDSGLIGGVSTFHEASNLMRAENTVRRSLSRGLVAKYCLEDLIHQSPLIEKVIRRSKRFAESDSTVLITGETGTGKEILAQGIHNVSQRKKGPFVSINCSALPDQLLESELFGYEEGAFTGSRKGGKPGLFEIAHHGTIFLDEIGTTPKNMQARLLRVLQEREVMRVGSDRLIPVDIRVIAATNEDLNKVVQQGRLRQDLFFRLNVLNVYLPPLRERVADIPLLVEALIKKTSAEYGIEPLSIPDAFIEKLLGYAWPGNVRQLENFLESLILLSDSRFQSKIFEELYHELYRYPFVSQGSGPSTSNSLKEQLARKTQDHEFDMIQKALRQSNYNKSKASKKLGVSRTTLWRKLKQRRMHSH